MTKTSTSSEKTISVTATSHSECQNCGTHLSERFHFCPHCGQPSHVHRLNFGHLVHEVVHFFTHADKGIFYLVRMLAVRPGVVAREYIRGKRKKYFNPLNFFLIVVGLFVFAQTTFRPMGKIDMTAAKQQIAKIPDESTRTRRLAKLERAEKATNFMAQYSNYINMAVTPLVSLIFFLAFYRAGYNFTEHLVANMYFAGFNALVYVFVITPFMVLTRHTSIYLYGIVLFLLWEVIYRTWGYYTFINKKGFRPLAYTAFIAIATVVAWAVFSRMAVQRYIDVGF
jgi:hypothetical protein